MALALIAFATLAVLFGLVFWIAISSGFLAWWVAILPAVILVELAEQPGVPVTATERWLASCCP